MSAALEDREFEYNLSDFNAIRDRIKQLAGIWLGDNKKPLVYSRIARRLRLLGLTRFQEYLALLDQQPSEQEFFVNALTTNLTSFFREAHHFDALIQYLQNAPPTVHNEPFRIWCAAASTGEEPYSIAISAARAFDSLTPPVKILATDIDSNVLKTAQTGVYHQDRVADLEPSLKKQFFLNGRREQANKVRVRPELIQLIEFKQLNLLNSRWPIRAGLDIIFCRNVMIYFEKTTQEQLLKRMTPLIKPKGYYIAGHSETISRNIPELKLTGKTIYQKISAEGF